MFLYLLTVLPALETVQSSTAGKWCFVKCHSYVFAQQTQIISKSQLSSNNHHDVMWKVQKHAGGGARLQDCQGKGFSSF